MVDYVPSMREAVGLNKPSSQKQEDEKFLRYIPSYRTALSLRKTKTKQKNSGNNVEEALRRAEIAVGDRWAGTGAI